MDLINTPSVTPKEDHPNSMPVIKNVGQSDNTPLKQKSLYTILDAHTQIVNKIIRRPMTKRYAETHYLYVDLNSGPGKYNDIDGSPLIFKSVANANKTPYLAILSEISKQNCNNLMTATSSDTDGYCYDCSTDMLQGSNIAGAFLNGGGWGIVCNEDNVITLNSILNHYKTVTDKKPYGMVYVDPNNHEARFDNFHEFFSFSRLRYLDLLIHVSGTSIKRLLHTSTTKRIADSISSINKKYWLIRKPYGIWQWTFLLGTNWDGFPQFKNLDFVYIDSDEGREYLRLINNTKEELLSENHIQPINNTYHTRSSGLSVTRP